MSRPIIDYRAEADELERQADIWDRAASDISDEVGRLLARARNFRDKSRRNREAALGRRLAAEELERKLAS